MNITYEYMGGALALGLGGPKYLYRNPILSPLSLRPCMNIVFKQSMRTR